MRFTTLEKLNDLEGKRIAQICEGGFTDDKANHCAHFVSHALHYGVGFTCRSMTGKGLAPATLRVQDLFAECVEVGRFADFSGAQCLTFVIDRRHVDLKKKTMTNVPKKHVGIYLNGVIWHYSNSQDKVVTQTPAEFAKHYAGGEITLFYGNLPL